MNRERIFILEKVDQVNKSGTGREASGCRRSTAIVVAEAGGKK